MVSLPAYLTYSKSIYSFCVWIFEGMEHPYKEEHWRSSRSVFTTLNMHLPTVNIIFGYITPGPLNTYTSADKTENKDYYGLWYFFDILNTLTVGSSLPDHMPILKNGYNVMLLRYLYINNSYVNVTRYIIENISNNVIFLWFVNEKILGSA